MKRLFKRFDDAALRPEDVAHRPRCRTSTVRVTPCRTVGKRANTPSDEWPPFFPLG